MTSKEIRQKYLDFFKSKEHVIIPSASLIPENDSSTLFTSSGMQPMVPYLLGEKHPEGNRLVDSQKSFRSGDIEAVGDNRHTTMFEMLGNWSLGDYFKKEQITWMFEFLVKEISLDPKNLYVTVFRGDETLKISRDDEAVNIWQELFKGAGIEAEAIDFAEKNGMQGGRIFYYDVEKNWWSRSGVPKNMPLGEPGGPDSEMFWDFGADLKLHENSEFKDQPCHVNCDCGRFLEIGNNVFMQYVKTEKGFELLPKGNIDFGGGLERILAAKNGDPDIFKTDLFTNIINRLEMLSGKQYDDSDENKKSMRIISDHLKAATFIIGDDKGITPSNTDQGYIVRRLIRRAIRYGKKLGITEESWTKEIAKIVAHDYHEIYPELKRNIDFIIDAFKDEEEKFKKTLEKGLKELEKMKPKISAIPISSISSKSFMTDYGLSGDALFNLYSTYGFPIELSLEEIKRLYQEYNKEQGVNISELAKEDEERILQQFHEALKKHQDLSRTASAGKFKGGLADAGEETKKLHTAAHLLLASLRKILGNHVVQKGSNITAERLRFDFSHSEKMTDEQKQQVEDLVNGAIEKDLPVVCEEMALEEAKNQGAMGVFESKYGNKVKVYTAGKDGLVFSKEICGGPHVDRTGVLGKFKIKKEESSSSGVRRIKAVLE